MNIFTTCRDIVKAREPDVNKNVFFAEPSSQHGRQIRCGDRSSDISNAINGVLLKR
jgi:hypothetical protein